MKTKVKICCIKSLEEAKLAVFYNASAIGLVSEMPSGPGVINENLISEIASQIPPCIASFLLTSKQKVTEIINQQKRCKTNTIQLVDELTEGNYSDLKFAMPGISIVQVLHVTDESVINKAKDIENKVDAILLDSGNPGLQTKILGGTGKVHNWEISRELVKNVNIPVFLAGGLNPQNVKKAIELVKPYGVDVCSGVRTKGKLDKQKLTAFFENIF